MKEFIDFLEKKGFTAEANSLKNGATSLSLNSKNMGDEGVKALAEGLKTNNSLTHLNLNNNQIGAEGAKSIAEGLKTNNSITELYLQNNQIGAEGAKAIAEALKTNNSITRLALTNNRIGGEGAKAIGEGLKTNNSITTLCLSDNQLGAEEAKAIAEALKTNSSITQLILHYSHIGDEGAKAIAEALKTNNSITKLYLHYSHIGGEGAKALAEALKTNTSITWLYLQNNKIGDEEIKQLQEYTQRNLKIAQENNNNKAEALNTQGNILANTGEYNTAIEKYNEAITIVKKPLYITNKINAEKNYERQQADLVAKQQELELAEKQQAELLAQIQQEQQKTEEYMIHQQTLIQQTMESIAKGIDSITGDSITGKYNKGILILGKTGAGKSTLTYWLAGKELEIAEDNNDMIFKAKKPEENIVINHSTVSETRIPGKIINDKGVAIWDCPGFMDTTGVPQEIANAIYIQKLFTINTQMKFILAVTEADLRNKANILPIVQQFTEIFTDIECLKNKVSLVVTKVNNRKDLNNIQTDFNRFLDQNHNIPVKTKKMLEFLKESIHVFYEPDEKFEKPGDVKKDTELLNTINSFTKYVDLSTTLNLANISISDEADKCAKDLLQITYNNINQLLGIFTKAISDPNKCMTGIKGNTFIDSYSIVESLPKSSTSEKNASFDNLPLHGSLDPFLKLDQIKSLQKELFKNLSNNNSNPAKDNFLKVLEVFEEFVINDNVLKQKIQNYAYVFKQQIDINKCFSEVCGNKPVYNMEQDLQECKEKIEEALKREIKLLEVEEGKINAENGEPDIAYYTKTIEYLDIYKDDQNCIKQKAKAYKNLGHIYNDQNKYKDAALNYEKALELNKELPDIYEKLGNILFNNKQYIEAIECFKIVDKSIKIENCFKEVIKLNSDDPNIRIDKGDYYFSIGRHDKAMGCYTDALSLSQDDNNRLAASKKIDGLSEIIGVAIRGEKYHYEKFNFDALHQALCKMTGQKQSLECTESNNLLLAASNDNHEVHINGSILDSHIS